MSARSVQHVAGVGHSPVTQDNSDLSHLVIVKENYVCC